MLVLTLETFDVDTSIKLFKMKFIDLLETENDSLDYALSFFQYHLVIMDFACHTQNSLICS